MKKTLKEDLVLPDDEFNHVAALTNDPAIKPGELAVYLQAAIHRIDMAEARLNAVINSLDVFFNERYSGCGYENALIAAPQQLQEKPETGEIND